MDTRTKSVTFRPAPGTLPMSGKKARPIRSEMSMLVPSVTSAFLRFLKLMGLIAWSSVRHPLTESVIDYERAEVVPKPVRNER